jgi:hypothetical protein
MDAISKTLPKKSFRGSILNQRFSASPAPSATSESQKSTSSKASKVVRDQFSSPEILQLADACKSHLRTQICFGNWTLDSDMSKPDWIWSIITGTPALLGETGRATAMKALQLVENDEVQKGKLVIYVCFRTVFLLILTYLQGWLRKDCSLQHGSYQGTSTHCRLLWFAKWSCSRYSS